MATSFDYDASYKKTFRVGGFVCMALLVYTLAALIIIIFVGGPPETVRQCFDVLYENRLQGLLRLDILTVFFMPLYYLLFYCLFIVLKKTDPALVTIAAILACAGVTLFLSSPSVFSYLNLSNRFAIAATDYEKNQLLAAGESILASDMWHGTGAIIGGLLLQLGALLISIIMLKTNIFSRITAIIGIVTFGLDLLHIIIGFFVPAIANIIMFVAGPLYFIWFPLIGLRFFKLGRA
jgi:hypothetical protein